MKIDVSTSALNVSLTMTVVGLFAIALGCQQPQQKTYTPDSGSGTASTGGVTSAGGGATAKNNLVTIPVGLQNLGGHSLALLGNATTFNISLVGCASGYTSTATEVSTALQVYKYDRGCLAKLTQFTYNGHTLTPTAGHPFLTWGANDTAVFDVAGALGPNAVNVTVLSQLGNPVTGTEAIVYQFSELVKGADQSLDASSVSAAHSLTVASQAPPSFTIKSVVMSGINATGGGQFTFTMECTAGIGITNLCVGVDMTTLTYKLVEDTFGSTLVVGDAGTIFGGGGATTVAMPGDREAPGGATTNGGFHSITLDGPDAMALHPHMIFIIQSGGVSYEYFNVDVAALTQD